jgi:hypothetical protein
MRNSKLIDRRLRELEGRVGLNSVVLTFSDGSTRAIKVVPNYHLDLFQHACSKLRCFPPPAPENEGVAPPPLEPQTDSDALIDLLGEAVSVEGAHTHFLQTIHELCRTLTERKAHGKNAPTVHDEK